jgi:THO complex subunit 2
MDNDRKEYISNVQSRISGAKTSQLAMSAPLESNALSHSKFKPPTPVEQKKSDVKDTNQKVGLLNAFLSVGAMQPAIAIMSKFPWLVDAHPEIADLMIRVMKASLSPLYDSLMVTKERNVSFTQARARYGASGVAYPNPRKPILTLWAPTPPSTCTTDFVFFFPDWPDRVPISSSLDDLETVIEPLMRFIGLHVSRDPLFLTKFLRLGRLHLQSTVPIDPQTKKPTGEPDPDNHVRLFWFQILRMYLLPALPLIRGNAVCTVEVWNIIRQYETTARWRLYGEWKTTTYRTHPELRIREVQADRESKGILRRLSHNTIDSLSGTVAKLAHSNPCIFFANAVNQIMAYDNLANVVIQALRYVTNMGFDVLVFVILDALANPRKERVKDDGVNTSDWLQSRFVSFLTLDDISIPRRPCILYRNAF